MTAGRVLVVNAGGVTLELTVVGVGNGAEPDPVEHEVYLDPWDGSADAVATAVSDAVDAVGDVDAVGHRVVHGGLDLVEPTIVDDDVVALLASCEPLAPVHQARTLDALSAARDALGVPHVACFDTWFHRTIGEAARTYAVPEAWRRAWPVRRFGFHGFSHEHVASRAPVVAGRPAARRVVSCHLASGVSLCAIADGESVDTTMGMTPTDGPVMATRSGSIDPGVVTWLVREGGLSIDEVASALDHESGLAALSGGSGDMRSILEARERGDRRAELAVDVYVHRLTREVGAMVAMLGGVDVLAFTGGVGQHLGVVRDEVAGRLAHLGVELDAERNRAAVDDADITAPGAATATVVVAGDEHHGIARHTRAAVERLGTIR